MKLKLFAMALMLPSITAMANNTITFYGEVTDQTCDVTVNSLSGDVKVQLPTVKVSDFASATTAGQTPFNFTISGCSTTATQTQVGLRLIPGATSAAGNLPNLLEDGAKNIEVQIIDSTTGSQQVISFNANDGGEYVTPYKNITTDATSFNMPFIAQYYKVADGTDTNGDPVVNTPTIGKVRAQLQYALAYQ